MVRVQVNTGAIKQVICEEDVVTSILRLRSPGSRRGPRGVEACALACFTALAPPSAKRKLKPCRAARAGEEAAPTLGIGDRRGRVPQWLRPCGNIAQSRPSPCQDQAAALT